MMPTYPPGTYILRRNEHGTYEARGAHAYAVSSGIQLEMTDATGTGKDAAVATVESIGQATALLWWLEHRDYETPVKLRKTAVGAWAWDRYPLVPRDTSNPRWGASDYELVGAPVPVVFYRLSNARAFLNAVKARQATRADA